MSATLYLRNVPDDVMARLQALAAATGSSVSATAIAELAAASKRADNPGILAALPDLGVSADRIIVDIEESRPAR